MLLLKLEEVGYTIDKTCRALDFIRFYVTFNQEGNQQTLDQNIQTIFKQQGNMGIREAILQEVKEQGIEQGIIQTARNMKKAGFTTKDIIKATGLTKVQIDAIS